MNVEQPGLRSLELGVDPGEPLLRFVERVEPRGRDLLERRPDTQSPVLVERPAEPL